MNIKDKSMPYIAIERTKKRYVTATNLAKVLGISSQYLGKIRQAKRLRLGKISVKQWVKVTGMKKTELFSQLYE